MVAAVAHVVAVVAVVCHPHPSTRGRESTYKGSVDSEIRVAQCCDVCPLPLQRTENKNHKNKKTKTKTKQKIQNQQTKQTETKTKQKPKKIPT